MQNQFSIAEAKNRLPSIIHYVEKGPYVKLTRRGKPVAVLLSIQEYERLSRKYSGFWSALSAFRQNIQDKGIEISDMDFDALRDTSAGREIELRG
jgi:prevent-host-death family protein